MSATSAPELAAPLDELHLHRLLVAIDGSPTAELALAAAVTAAQRDHAAITLLAVVADVARMLRETVARIPQDIPVTTVIRHGKAGAEIVAQACEHDYDAVLLGARGLGRVGALLGSVSAYVLHRAPVPVFVAHAPNHPHT
jgi:nucleotide-binding universal stress UspA family protein